MKTILAAMFAVMIGLAFAGSTFAQPKTDAPAATPATPAAPAGEMKKDEGMKKADDGKAKGKKKKHKNGDKDKDKDKDKMKN